MQLHKTKHDFIHNFLHKSRVVVGRGGFEPPKSKTSDLQSDPFGRSGICPYIDVALLLWSRWLDSNPQPADYKSAALPIELHRQVSHLLGGALGRNWTTDRQIFSLLLYRLSYQGIYGDPERARTVDLQRDRLAL